MKVAIIAIAKNENQYINEWVNYHLNIGFDNIVVCDNDDTLILKDIIDDPRVIIEDWTGVPSVQQPAYQETFEKYHNQFDWTMFLDVDEFLVLENHKNVKDFINSFPDDVFCIRLSWKHFTDNNELDVKDNNYNVFDRFKTPVDFKMDKWVKYFLKTSVTKNDGLRMLHQHSVGIKNRQLKSVNALGELTKSDTPTQDVVHKVAWINHYRTKTIGEYVRQKYFRGGPNYNNIKYRNLRYFWETNEKTPEKEEYAKKLIEEIGGETK